MPVLNKCGCCTTNIFIDIVINYISDFIQNLELETFNLELETTTTKYKQL